jgi:uncharacterized protein DUF955
VSAPFYRWEEIEAMAAALHRRFEAYSGVPLSLPVDIDAIGEQLLGLSWLYELLPEPRGMTILAALFPERQLVVLNERHSEAFGRNEGLERFTKAHELGHWVCHVGVGRRKTVVGSEGVRAAVGPLSEPALHACTTAVYRLPTAACEAERDWQEKHANWFAAALLMPPVPLRRAAAEVDISAWRGRYELRDRCGVSISALNARLRQLGYPDVR